jgi:hypothetical protein
VSENTSPVVLVSAVIKGSAAKPINLADRIQSMTYEESDTKSDKLTLLVRNEDLANFDTPLWRAGMRLIVQWGYWRNLGVPREVVVKSVKGFTTLTVECLDKGSLMGEKKKTGGFKNQTRSEVVTTIADAYGYGPDSRFITETTRKFGRISYGGKSDGELVAALTKAEGFQHYVDHTGFHWHPRDFAQRPVRTFCWGAAREDAEAIIDEPQIDMDLTVPRPTKIKAKGIDRKTGAPFEVTASDTETDRTGLAPTMEGMEEWAAKIAPEPDAGAEEGFMEDLKSLDGVGEGLGLGDLLGLSEPAEMTDENTLDLIDEGDGESNAVLIPPDFLRETEEISDMGSHDATEAKTKVDGRFRKLREVTVKMTFSALGDPSFLGKRVFRFEAQAPGCKPCKRLSGNYYAKTVTHELTPGSYTMKIEAVSDGSNGDGKKSGAKVNTKEPADSPTSPDGGKTTEETQHELEEVEIVDERDGTTRVVYN